MGPLQSHTMVTVFKTSDPQNGDFHWEEGPSEVLEGPTRTFHGRSTILRVRCIGLRHSGRYKLLFL
jgi:hypothetical protein